MATTNLPQAAPPKQPTESAGSAEAGRKPVKSHRRENLALVSAFEARLRVENYSLSTRQGYVPTVSDYVEFLHSESALEADRPTIRRYMGYLDDRGKSKLSIDRALSALRKFYDYLVRDGLLDRSPLMLIQFKRPPSRIPDPLSEAEAERLIEAAEGPRDRALAELLYATGCRASELTGMRVEDVNFPERTICVGGKGLKEAFVFFGNKAEEALRRHLDGRTGGHLFLGRRGGSLSPRTVGAIIKKLGQRVGLAGVHPHRLRHSFASHLIDSGADVMYVKELLRHESVRTTQIYLHTSVAGVRRVYDRCFPRA